MSRTDHEYETWCEQNPDIAERAYESFFVATALPKLREWYAENGADAAQQYAYNAAYRLLCDAGLMEEASFGPNTASTFRITLAGMKRIGEWDDEARLK